MGPLVALICCSKRVRSSMAVLCCLLESERDATKGYVVLCYYAPTGSGSPDYDLSINYGHVVKRRRLPYPQQLQEYDGAVGRVDLLLEEGQVVYGGPVLPFRSFRERPRFTMDYGHHKKHKLRLFKILKN